MKKEKKNKTKKLPTTNGLIFLVNDWLKMKKKMQNSHRETNEKNMILIRWGGGGGQYKH